MRRFVFLFIIVSGIAGFAVSCAQRDDVPKVNAELYFADARLNRLLKYDDELIDASTENMAECALKKLIAGRDDNDNIRRIIPEMDKCLTVKVKGTTAYVDINSKIKSEMSCHEETERLFIYLIVNTFTSIRGIRFVKFTIDGSIRKDFMGFYDMRDTFKYTYPE